MKKFLQFI